MNILLIGSGGREHALAFALKKSASCDELYCVPGNPGIFELAQKADISDKDFNEIIDFCKENSIGLVVVGPEQPLAEGIADILEEAGINVFGPKKYAAQLESSKGFAKEFMIKLGIPTAKYKKFDATQSKNAHEYIDAAQFPIVLKADGLAAGKGVIIANEAKQAHEALDSMFEGLFSEAGKTVVIENFLKGEEASILAVCDGEDYITLASSQDHKRAKDGDIGKNTGGMGAYAPAPIVTDDVLGKVKAQIIKPALKGMAEAGVPFKGCLYAGLMIDNGNPSVVEFNVRFGDPETQAVLTVFDGDLAGLMASSAKGSIDKSFANNVCAGSSCCVIISSNGYPDSYEKGYEITGIKDAEADGAVVFHAGTAIKDGKLINTGGRVLGVCGKAENLKDSIESAYKAVDQIKFDNMFFRKDIAKKGLKGE